MYLFVENTLGVDIYRTVGWLGFMAIQPLKINTKSWLCTHTHTHTHTHIYILNMICKGILVANFFKGARVYLFAHGELVSSIIV